MPLSAVFLRFTTAGLCWKRRELVLHCGCPHFTPRLAAEAHVGFEVQGSDGIHSARLLEEYQRVGEELDGAVSAQ